MRAATRPPEIAPQQKAINGIERRTADAQNAVAALAEKVDGLELTGGQVDLDALATAVADKLAARLAA